MLRNFFFTMSLSGTAVFLLYIILYPLARRFLSARWRYYTLCTCIFFYLFPLPLQKNRVFYFLRSQPVIQELPVLNPPVSINNSFLILHHGDKVRIAPLLLFTWGLMGFCGAVALFLAVRTFRRYRYARKVCLAAGTVQVPERWQEILQETRSQLHIRRKIRLLCSCRCAGPATFGLFSPIILFPVPSDAVDEKTFRLILTHELTHIKYHHLYIRYAALLVRAVHWFNPLVWLWFQKLCDLSEMMCDEIVVKDMEPKQIQRYCRMILSCAANDASCPTFSFSAHLTEDAVTLERRISEMKSKKRKHLIPALLLSLAIGTTGTITAFAYTPPDRIESPVEEPEGFYTAREAEDYTDNIIELPYDYYYTDSDGNVYPLSDHMVTPKSCSHSSWSSITTTRHTPDGKGGCTIAEWQAEKCSGCGSIKFIEEIYTLHYNKCPH